MNLWWTSCIVLSVMKVARGDVGHSQLSLASIIRIILLLSYLLAVIKEVRLVRIWVCGLVTFFTLRIIPKTCRQYAVWHVVDEGFVPFP